ncbi:polymorphic toxin-type HINT domain-containing protein [Saccharopolyspora cebuensis]|uniref:Polymorphic toxin-type HINT domain-containing protein n=1 Tax=Saccharopolyspora cebuensis TaxID=418759 RepID=A0ABV4CNT2_9PSEU
MLLTLVLSLVLGTASAAALPGTPDAGSAAHLGERVAAVDQRLAALPRREAELRAAETSLRARTGAHDARSRDVAARLDSVRRRIDAHNAEVDQYPNGAPPAVARALNSRAAALNAEQARLLAEDGALSAESGALASEEARLESRQAQLDHDRTALPGQRQQLLRQWAGALVDSLGELPETVRQAPGGDPARPPGDRATRGDPTSRQDEAAALDDYAERHGVEVDMRPGTATLSPRAVGGLPVGQAAGLRPRCLFAGLVPKPSGTYTALVVGPRSAAEQNFDRAVARGGAVAVRDGQRVTVDEVTTVPRRRPDRCPVPNSFAPGTRVLLADGSSRPIELIRPGDLVRSTDPVTGRTAPRPVTALSADTGRKDLQRLTIGGATLTTTADHPFWDPGRRTWVEAGELRPGQVLSSTPDRAPVRVTANSPVQQHRTVHNLSVADFRTYYVLAAGTPVLVHNSAPCPQPSRLGTDHRALGDPNAAGGVYALLSASGIVVRTGMAKNLRSRLATHQRNYPELTPVVLYRTDSRAARRGLEQMAENRYSPVLANQRAIRRDNPRYDEYLSAARDFLARWG